MNRKLLKEAILKRYSHLGSTEAIDRFSKEIGVSKGTLYNMLRHTMPKEDVLIKMVTILDLDYNELFRKE